MCSAWKPSLFPVVYKQACVLMNVIQEVLFTFASILQNGGTPLVIASWHGHRETVEVLIRSGADINTLQQVSIIILHFQFERWEFNRHQ